MIVGVNSFRDCGLADIWQRTLLAPLASLWKAGRGPPTKVASTADRDMPLWVTA